MLYTTKQIAELYSSSENEITPYMITHTWIAQGLKHLRGKGKGFLYKKEWVDEFLEMQAIVNTKQQNNVKIHRKLFKSTNVMKVV